MGKAAYFKVDPRLATLLGESYRSTELAIKELVDNCYDADASSVSITLPEPFTDDPIIIADDGTGMTEKEIREEYLKVANSRLSRKGERTLGKNRLVKGRKGIGKFAGLVVAELMEVHSAARDQSSRLEVSRTALSKAEYDLEKIDLPLHSESTPGVSAGTRIVLHGINDNLTFPNAERLKQILMLEYGQVPDFQLFVNGEKVDLEDIPGVTFNEQVTLPTAGSVQLRYTISDGKKPLRQSGLIIRVKGKVVGRPEMFGMEQSDAIPPKLLKRLFGEIVADGLENDVTADWGAVIENSKAYQEIREFLQAKLNAAFEATLDAEVKLAKQRLRRKINKGLDQLPEFRRGAARRALDRVMVKFFGESEERISSVIAVVLEAFEQDEYASVVDALEKVRFKGPEAISDALSEFGAIDAGMRNQQARNRFKVLDELNQLTTDASTSEEQLFKALEKNLWVLGPTFSFAAPSETLQGITEQYLSRKYRGKSPKRRPQLLLLETYNRQLLLIDFRKPYQQLNGEHQELGAEYRNAFGVFFPNRQVEVLFLGGNSTVDSPAPGIRFVNYSTLLNDAGAQLNWVLKAKPEGPQG